MIDYSLYLCTNSDMNKHYPIEKCVEQAIQGGVNIVQVREKDKSFNEFLDIASKIKKITDKYGIPLIINDNIKIAEILDADGVHIGQNDIACCEARNLLGDKKIIGVSVSNLKEAKQAVNDGASYLGVGAIFRSTTKKDAKVVGVEELKRIIDASPIPIVVIGGINKNSIPIFKGLNIDGYAMIRPILAEDNIRESSKTLKKIIKRNKI